MAMAVGLQSNNWKGNENFFAYEMHPFYLFNALFANNHQSMDNAIHWINLYPVDA